MNPQHEEARALLQELISEGRLDSSGRFTLSADAARKLRGFQLAERYGYVLPLVSWGLQRGPTRIDLRNDTDDFEMYLDGRPLALGEFQCLVDFLSAASGEVSSLGLALNAAAALEPAAITVESWDGTSGYRLNLSAHTPGLHGLESTPNFPAGTRIHIREKTEWRLAAKFLKNAFRGRPETLLVRRHFRHCQTRLRVNGRRLDGPVDLGSCLRWLWLQGKPCLRHTAPEDRTVRQVTGEDYSAVLGLSQETRWQGVDGPCLGFCVQGVTFYRHCPEFGHPGLRGVVVAPALRPDLSWNGPTEDEPFQQLIAGLKSRVEALIADVVSDGAAGMKALAPIVDAVLPRARLETLIPALTGMLNDPKRRVEQGWGSDVPRQLAAALLKAGRPGAALELLGRLARNRLGNEMHPDEVTTFLDLGSAQLEAGQPAVARDTLIGVARRGERPYHNFSDSVLPAVANLVETLRQLGNREEARLLAEEAAAGVEAAPQWTELHILKARLWLSSGDLAKAEEECARAADGYLLSVAPARGDDVVRRATLCDQRALVALLRDPQLPEIEGHLQQALEFHRQGLEEPHPEIAGTRSLLAIWHFENGRGKEAFEELEVAVSDLRQVYGGQHPDVCHLLALKALWQYRTNQPAVNALREALAGYQQHLLAGDRRLAAAEEFLGLLLHREGRLDEAVALWENSQGRLVPAELSPADPLLGVELSRTAPAPGPLEELATVGHGRYWTANYYWPRPGCESLPLRWRRRCPGLAEELVKVLGCPDVLATSSTPERLVQRGREVRQLLGAEPGAGACTVTETRRARLP